MLDVAILLLRIALVAVLYLFLLFVIRGSVRALRAPVVPTVSLDTKLLLRVVDGGRAGLDAGASVHLSPGSVIGRALPADVVVADQTVSARHAQFDVAGGAWRVTDLGSTNGTRLNDRPVITPTRLQTGDRLELGAVRFEVGDTSIHPA